MSLVKKKCNYITANDTIASLYNSITFYIIFVNNMHDILRKILENLFLTFLLICISIHISRSVPKFVFKQKVHTMCFAK